MNIQGDFQSLKILGSTEVSAAENSPVPQSSNSVAGQVDEAHLSGAAHVVSQAIALSDVRSEKVASVQAALASGNYQVSSSDLAAKLIDHMQR